MAEPIYPAGSVTVVVRDGQRYTYDIETPIEALLDDLAAKGVRPGEIVRTVHSIASGRFPKPVDVEIDHTGRRGL